MQLTPQVRLWQAWFGSRHVLAVLHFKPCPSRLDAWSNLALPHCPFPSETGVDVLCKVASCMLTCLCSTVCISKGKGHILFISAVIARLLGAVSPGAEGMSFVFTWLRLSANKLLDWSRRSNYQSKDIGWVQKVISEHMAEKVGQQCSRDLMCD